MPFSAPIAPTRIKPPRLRLASFAPKWWAMSRCDAGEDRFVVKNARNQSEGSFFFDERDRLLNQIDLTHEFASQRKLPLFSGEFRKRSKCDLARCDGYGIKRADGLIKAPDAFAALDLDLKIARFVPDLDYLMASTRQCLLNQFPDLSVCANRNNFHKHSILVSDLRIYLLLCSEHTINRSAHLFQNKSR